MVMVVRASVRAALLLLCHSGIGIGGVVVLVVMMVWYLR